MGKDYRDEKNREKRFRGKKNDHVKKTDYSKKNKKGGKFNTNVEFSEDEPFGQ
jgi:hypothetical protein